MTSSFWNTLDIIITFIICSSNQIKSIKSITLFNHGILFTKKCSPKGPCTLTISYTYLIIYNTEPMSLQLQKLPNFTLIKLRKLFKLVVCLASTDRLFHKTAPLYQKHFLNASVYGLGTKRLCCEPRRFCL